MREERINSRQRGLDWLDRMGRATDERKSVSKYFSAEESFTHAPVWFFEFSERYAIEGQFLNLLCQVAPDSSDFRHLRVPMRYFLEHKEGLWFREDKLLFAPHLSAEKPSLFREMRGNGRIEFGAFEVK
jgi:hypothetical protein